MSPAVDHLHSLPTTCTAPCMYRCTAPQDMDRLVDLTLKVQPPQAQGKGKGWAPVKSALSARMDLLMQATIGNLRAHSMAAQAQVGLWA